MGAGKGHGAAACLPQESIEVRSTNVNYSPEYITSNYEYHTSSAEVCADGVVRIEPQTTHYQFRTKRTVPKLGVMMVGWGGNNGSTVTAGILANRLGITWHDKEGIHHPDYFGSLTQCSTLLMGQRPDTNEDVWMPFSKILPMVNPNDVVVGGWDISSANLAESMRRAEVLDYDLQRQLVSEMEQLKPLPSVYFPDFIAANQEDRADNVLTGSKMEQMETLRQNIRDFKTENELDSVIVLWTANTERFADVLQGVNDTQSNLMEAIRQGHDEIAPSTLFAVASILEGCTYINGSPQNTFVPGVFELAETHNVFIAGDDFKTGQTKFKSVLTDFLVGAGIKPVSIVSYNHLGNNDGKNLSAPKQFRSKEISKSNVVDDMVASNNILFKQDEHPDHCVVIKYVPHVGDSKRALDEYTSKIFLNGTNTIVCHNTCEDSLLAAPLIIDLFILAEMFERIEYRVDPTAAFEPFLPVMSALGFLLKAPFVNRQGKFFWTFQG